MCKTLFYIPEMLLWNYIPVVRELMKRQLINNKQKKDTIYCRELKWESKVGKIKGADGGLEDLIEKGASEQRPKEMEKLVMQISWESISEASVLSVSSLCEEQQGASTEE